MELAIIAQGAFDVYIVWCLLTNTKLLQASTDAIQSIFNDQGAMLDVLKSTINNVESLTRCSSQSYRTQLDIERALKAQTDINDVLETELVNLRESIERLSK